MPDYSLDTDPSGLPKTTVGNIPYEIDALTPKESWGAGNGSTTIACRQKWAQSTDWIRAMVGRCEVVKPGSTPLLRRSVPQRTQFTDDRPHWCSIIDQIDQGGDTGSQLRTPVTGWPRTDWCRFRAVFEVFPYRLLTELEVDLAQDCRRLKCGRSGIVPVHDSDAAGLQPRAADPGREHCGRL